MGMRNHWAIPVLVSILILSISFSSVLALTEFSTDFNAGAPSEFSGITTTEPVQGFAGLGTGTNTFGGDFLRNTSVPPLATILTLTGLPTHNNISINFLLSIIDSWDGIDCGAVGFSGDTFNVRVDGSLIFSEVFENSNCGTQSYVPPPGVELARKQSLGFTPTGFNFADSAYDMGLDPTFQNIPHTASTLTIEWFAGGGWQGGNDESWAIENVKIILDDPKKKSCDALDKASENGKGKKKGLERAKANNDC